MSATERLEHAGVRDAVTIEIGMQDLLVAGPVPQPRVILDHVETERDHEIGRVDDF